MSTTGVHLGYETREGRENAPLACLVRSVKPQYVVSKIECQPSFYSCMVCCSLVPRVFHLPTLKGAVSSLAPFGVGR